MPVKVHSARLPPAFGLFCQKIGKLDKKLLLPPEMVMLIREQDAQPWDDMNPALPKYEQYLGFEMEWVRHHDRYGTNEFADVDKPYWPETASPSSAACGCGAAEAHA
jgi:hypothetical protein